MLPYTNRPSILQRLVAAAARPYDPSNSILNLAHQNRLQRISAGLHLVETRFQQAELGVHQARLEIDKRLGGSGQGVIAYDTSTVGSPTPVPSVTAPPLPPVVATVTQTATSSGVIVYTITGTAQNGSLLRVWNVPYTAANPGNGPIAIDAQSGAYSGPGTPFSAYSVGAIAPAGAALQITAADPANPTSESTPVPVAATTPPAKPASPTVTTVTLATTLSGNMIYTISGTAPAGSVLRVWAMPYTAANPGTGPLAFDALAGTFTGPSTPMVPYTIGAVAPSGAALQITAADPTNLLNESAPAPVSTTTPPQPPASPTVTSVTPVSTSTGVVYTISGNAPAGSVLRVWATPNTAASPGTGPLATDALGGSYSGPGSGMVPYTLGALASGGIGLQITAADPANLASESTPRPVPTGTPTPTTPTVATVNTVATTTGNVYTISGNAPAGSVLRVWAVPNNAANPGSGPLATDALGGTYAGPATSLVAYAIGALAPAGAMLQITAADPTNLMSESAPAAVPTIAAPPKPAAPTVSNVTPGTTPSGQVVYSLTGMALAGSVLRAWITPNTAATPGATPLVTDVVAGTYAGQATAMTAYSLGVVANYGVALQVTAADPANLNNESTPTAIPLVGLPGSATPGSSVSYSGSVSPSGQSSQALSLAPRIIRFSPETTVPVERREVNLDWMVSNAQSVTINGTPVSEYGTLTVTPTETTTYTLDVQGKDGTRLTRSITLTVITEMEREAYFEIFSELGQHEYQRGRPKPTSVNEKLYQRGFDRRPKEVIDTLFAEHRARADFAEDEELAEEVAEAERME